MMIGKWKSSISVSFWGACLSSAFPLSSSSTSTTSTSSVLSCRDFHSNCQQCLTHHHENDNHGGQHQQQQHEHQEHIHSLTDNDGKTQSSSSSQGALTGCLWCPLDETCVSWENLQLQDDGSITTTVMVLNNENDAIEQMDEDGATSVVVLSEEEDDEKRYNIFHHSLCYSQPSEFVTTKLMTTTKNICIGKASATTTTITITTTEQEEEKSVITAKTTSNTNTNTSSVIDITDATTDTNTTNMTNDTPSPTTTTNLPSMLPTNLPTTSTPSSLPSQRPSMYPSTDPSTQPSISPSIYPSSQPSIEPSVHPTNTPTTFPSYLFDDPSYSNQLWVYNMINIIPVWKDMGYYGTGIHVRVNDGYVDGDHVEFQGRFDWSASCDDVKDYAYNESIHTTSSPDHHGTMVASVVGAGGNNGNCMVGIAPNVSLSSCYALKGSETFFEEKLEYIDISQNSFERPGCTKRPSTSSTSSATTKKNMNNHNNERFLRDVIVPKRRRLPTGGDEEIDYDDDDDQCPFTVRGKPNDPCEVCNFYRATMIPATAATATTFSPSSSSTTATIASQGNNNSNNKNINIAMDEEQEQQDDKVIGILPQIDDELSEDISMSDYHYSFDDNNDFINGDGSNDSVDQNGNDDNNNTNDNDDNDDEICENYIIQHCNENYEYDVEGCSEFWDLILEQNNYQCKYNVLSTQARTSITNGIINGRDGLGIIFIFASGNAYHLGDYTTIKGYTNTRYTITVGAVGGDGIHSSYSTSGPSIFISAPGGDFGQSSLVVATLHDTCRSYGGGLGTSFSAPIVSGVVALMLEANPYLTWRDVQRILASTSQRPPSTSLPDDGDDGTIINGGGYWHSDLYGFGIIDAKKAVETAVSWHHPPDDDEKFYSASSGIINLPIIDDDGTTTTTSTITITSSSSIDSENNNIDLENFIIESVVVLVDMDHISRGDVEIIVTSPYGTSSILHRGNIPENEQLSINERWKLLTVKHWNEHVLGPWTLSIRDIKLNTNNDDDDGTNHECIDAPYNVVYSNVDVTCSYLERTELCFDGGIDEEFFSDGSFDDLVYDTTYEGKTFQEACCICGGTGIGNINDFVNMLKSWNILFYGRTDGISIPSNQGYLIVGNDDNDDDDTVPSSIPTLQPISNRDIINPTSLQPSVIEEGTTAQPPTITTTTNVPTPSGTFLSFNNSFPMGDWSSVPSSVPTETNNNNHLGPVSSEPSSSSSSPTTTSVPSLSTNKSSSSPQKTAPTQGFSSSTDIPTDDIKNVIPTLFHDDSDNLPTDDGDDGSSTTTTTSSSSQANQRRRSQQPKQRQHHETISTVLLITFAKMTMTVVLLFSLL